MSASTALALEPPHLCAGGVETGHRADVVEVGMGDEDPVELQLQRIEGASS